MKLLKAFAFALVVFGVLVLFISLLLFAGEQASLTVYLIVVAVLLIAVLTFGFYINQK